MKSNLTNQLAVAVLALALGAQGASAQTIGRTLGLFNVLANPQVTLTGFSPSQPLTIAVVGTSPGATLTLTNASATTYHANDSVAANAQTEALALWNSLTAPAGATYIALAANTLPATLTAGPGITVFTAAADITNVGAGTTITGSASSVVIFQVTTSLSMTDADVILAGGIKANNVYWRVVQAVTVVNDDASNRTFPGIVINNTNAQDIAVTCSGAGKLDTGRFFSLGGSISITNSGAGAFAFTEAAGAPATTIGSSACDASSLYPSPATGRTGTFAYCMESPGTVKIKVYNVVGDLASKIEDRRSAGLQASTVNTGRLAPGVYLYLLERHYDNGTVSRSGVKKFAVKR